ncbi:MAG: glycoside hydrolase family 43 protein [Butyrivibrio sp.]|nr:glycoside hydrolase family 43 protein [Acetatifactor muris]MCM1559406.1 glycoside hydrolase family 43 protein [Butyrivibrio sp.]
MSVTAKNPVMPGFYPDPSICGVDGDYYMIHSTFSYFPGLPIMHSRDLAHWEQIGNAMHRQEQLPLKNAGHSQGLFAPTIRYHDGTYYVICTNVSYGGNYIVTAKNPAGPWSDPYYLEGADGIDPSLFFDEDGKCYYIGTHPNPAGCRYDGDYFIWIRELDLGQMKLTGEVHNVWNGAMRGVHWPEGPHLYKKDGYYYILHAEGGTGPDHAVTVCRSREIYGPYENNFCNPILTHRHLGKAYPVRYVGHGDMVETPIGEWYMVMLAVRPLEGYTTMGRETFLARVVWENGWPVVNPGVGVLTEEVEIHLPAWNPEEDNTFDTAGSCVPGSSRSYDFTAMEKLGDEFLMLRNPGEDMYALDGEGLKLSFRSVTLKEKDSPSYICVRQQHHAFRASAVLEMENLREGRRAGMALVQSNEYHLRVELGRGETGIEAAVILCSGGSDRMLGQHLIQAEEEAEIRFDEAELTLRAEGLAAAVELTFNQTVRATGECVSGRALLCGGIDIRALSTETAGGFVGCTVGMYAVAERDCREQAVCFKSFSYRA